MILKDFITKYILPVIMFILIIVVWSAADFLKESSGLLPKIMASNLSFRVNPVVIGGDIIAEIDDPIGDNTALELPKNKKFHNGYLSTDLLTYTVHKPVKNTKNEWVWNIDLEFNKLKHDNNKFDLIKGTIYIDINDNINDGNSRAYSTGEKITFDSGFKWDYMVSFDYLHNTGKLYSNNTEKNYDVQVTLISKEEKIRLSIPIVEKLNKKMDKKYMGKHIAAIGFYSPIERGGLLPVNYRADRTHSGGGINYKIKSPYFDFIADNINNNNENYIKISPVNLDRTTVYDYKSQLSSIKKKLEKLANKKGVSKYYVFNNEKTGDAVNLINNKKYEEAERILSKYLDSSSIANTLYGLIQSYKAGSDNISISKKVSLVNNAYNYFNTAENLVKTDNDLYILLINRIGVSTSVPDDVFGKLEKAEKDLKKILTLDLSVENKADLYLKLISIYEKKKNKRELKILIYKIKKII